MMGAGDNFSRQKEIQRNSKESVKRLGSLGFLSWKLPEAPAPPIFTLGVASSSLSAESLSDVQPDEIEVNLAAFPGTWY